MSRSRVRSTRPTTGPSVLRAISPRGALGCGRVGAAFLVVRTLSPSSRSSSGVALARSAGKRLFSSSWMWARRLVTSSVTLGRLSGRVRVLALELLEELLDLLVVGALLVGDLLAARELVLDSRVEPRLLGDRVPDELGDDLLERVLAVLCALLALDLREAAPPPRGGRP